MKNKMIIIMVVLFGIMSNCLAFAQDKPILVFNTIILNQENGGILVPEFAINSDGSWRKAIPNDIRIGQELELYDRTQNPILQGKIVVNLFEDDYYLQCNNLDENLLWNDYWGINKTNQRFQIVGQGKAIKPQYMIRETASKALLDLKQDIKERLQNVVKADWLNIQNQFPKLKTSNISDFMVGDINGDGKDDYVLILSDLEHMKGEGLFIYLSNGRNFEMIPIRYREYDDNYFCWFMLDLMMDFNGDGTKEFMVLDVDGDSCSPRIYGWNTDSRGLMKLYEGYELYNG